MTDLTKELLRALPKTDLHCHLDGSLRLTTILELAEQQGIQMGADDPASLKKLLNAGARSKSLEEYLKAFEFTLRVLQTEEALYRAAYELGQDAAAENVRYLEVRYAPMLHTANGLALAAIVEAVVGGLAAARQEFGVQSGVIISGIRNQAPEMSVQLAELAVAYKNRGVVAFDLAGAEEDYPAKRHREAFYVILNNNVNCTLHAGEAYGPESIAQAIHWCGAHRVGHGTRLLEDKDLLDYVNDHRIPLEVCLSSNLQTNTVAALSQHPLRFYFDYGVRTTINTDNRLISDTTVSNELWLAHQHLGFNLQEIKQLILYGFKSAFLPFADKRALLRSISEELHSIDYLDHMAD